MAALVWTYCDGRHDRDAIADAVARELPEPGDDVEDRVTALLAQFVSQGNGQLVPSARPVRQALPYPGGRVFVT